jgi:hypothetical protein
MMLPRPHRSQHLAAYLLTPPPKTSIGTPSSAVAPDKLASAESGSDDLTFVQKVVTKEKVWQESYSAIPTRSRQCLACPCTPNPMC